MQDDEVDPVVIAILAQLWRAQQESQQASPHAARRPADGAWSLAKLSKQAGVPMSALRRQLTSLVDSGLVVTTLAEDGSGSASLSDEGRALCAEVFGTDG